MLVTLQMLFNNNRFKNDFKNVIKLQWILHNKYDMSK